jgi:prophage maintenance system killer protein
VIGVLLLEIHGFDFKASEVDATQAVMVLASGTLDEAALTAWLRENPKRKRRRQLGEVVS